MLVFLQTSQFRSFGKSVSEKTVLARYHFDQKFLMERSREMLAGASLESEASSSAKF